MPCSDGRDNDSYQEAIYRSDIRQLKNELSKRQDWMDNYAKMLCRQCRVLESLSIVDPSLDVFDPEVKEWWEKHKIEDAARAKAEKEKKDRDNKIKLEQYLKLKKELEL